VGTGAGVIVKDRGDESDLGREWTVQDRRSSSGGAINPIEDKESYKHLKWTEEGQRGGLGFREPTDEEMWEELGPNRADERKAPEAAISARRRGEKGVAVLIVEATIIRERGKKG